MNDHFRESETEQYGTVGRGELGNHIVFGKIHLIIMRKCHFALVGEPACTLLLIKLGRANHRHDGELPVVVNPGTGLVCLLETTDLVRGIDVLPAVTHLTCLRSPEVHTPGTCDRRIGITGGKLESRLRADKRTDIPGKVLGMQPQGSAHKRNNRINFRIILESC